MGEGASENLGTMNPEETVQSIATYLGQFAWPKPWPHDGPISGPVLVGSQGISREVLRHQEGKTPVESTIWGLLGTAWEGLKPRYIISIITCPKPEQDTWVAPSIKRAKS